MNFIVVPSEFSKDVLTRTTAEWHNQNTGERGSFRITKPIVVIPEWFERHSSGEKSEAVNFKLPTDVNFLHVGQWGNRGGFGEDRKNIADMVRYFYTFFEKEPNVGLVLKTNIINNTYEDFLETKRRLAEIKKNFKDPQCHLHLIHDTLTEEEMYNLYKHPQISAILSLTHGEGYGLPLLEAAACGLPVIATDWSGHRDFLRPKNGYIPLEYDMIEIPDCQVWDGVIDKGAQWAKVQEKTLKRKLKKFASGPKFIQNKAQANVKWLDENFGRQAVMEKWRNFFDSYILQKHDGSVPIEAAQYHDQKKMMIERISEAVVDSDKEKVLFIMPRSTGDVLLSTAIVDSLIKSRHFESDFSYVS